MDVFVEDIMTELGCVEGWPSSISLCVTGETFDCLTSFGLRGEGAIIQTSFSQEDAINKYLKELSKYLKARKGPVYWRQKPEVAVFLCIFQA